MSEVLKLVCGWIGATLALFFFISPVVPFMRLIKKQVKFDTIPIPMLICNVLNCVLWFSYGLYINEYPVWVCNGVGAIITSVWIIIYWVFFAELKWIPAIIYNLIYINIIGELYYIVHVIGGKEGNAIVGWVVMGINILMYAAPGAKVISLFKTGDLNLLPIVSSVCALVNSTFWFIYGMTLLDFTIIVPNGLGVVFGILQIIAWVIVKRRNIVKQREEDAKPKPTQEAGIELGNVAKTTTEGNAAGNVETEVAPMKSIGQKGNSQDNSATKKSNSQEHDQDLPRNEVLVISH